MAQGSSWQPDAAPQSGASGWKARGLLVLLALYVPLAIGVGAGVGSFFYITKQLAAPVVCPADTRSAYVVAHVFDSNEGTSWDTWLYCESADGTRLRQGYLPVAGTLAAYTWLVLALFTLLIRARARWRSASGPLAAATLALAAGVLVLAVTPMVVAPGCGTLRDEAFDATGGEYLAGRGPQLLRAQLRSQLGFEPRLSSISMSGSSATLTVQNPDNPRFLDRYTLRQGALEGPTPVQNPSARDLEHLFSLDEVPLDVLPAAVEECASQIGKPLQKLWVSVDGWSRALRVRVSCSNPRLSAAVVLDRDGVVVEGASSRPAP